MNFQPNPIYSFASPAPKPATKPISIFQEALAEKDDEAELEEARKLSANVRSGASRLKQIKPFFRHYSMPKENSAIPKKIPQNKYFDSKVESVKQFEEMQQSTGVLVGEGKLFNGVGGI